jgi:hypothetical protein
MSTIDSAFEPQPRPFNIASPEIITDLSNESKTMDGTVLITCCACGSGPSVSEIAPACTSCGHVWEGCYYCAISEV